MSKRSYHSSQKPYRKPGVAHIIWYLVLYLALIPGLTILTVILFLSTAAQWQFSHRLDVPSVIAFAAAALTLAIIGLTTLVRLLRWMLRSATGGVRFWLNVCIFPFKLLAVILKWVFHRSPKTPKMPKSGGPYLPNPDEEDHPTDYGYA
jgi:hypothetical protein